MTTLKHKYQVPRINTRGCYDLRTGKQLKNKRYNLYPKSKFDKIFNADEIVIFVHGMRNTVYGAKKGTNALRLKLRQLGYLKHPVVAFSYDANVRGAHLKKGYDKVLKTASKIAKSNGKHLLYFIKDLKKQNKNIKIHIVGHSLGCEVIAEYLRIEDNAISSVHLFGSPVEILKIYSRALCSPVKRFVNYYNIHDNEILMSVKNGYCFKPSCLIKKNMVKGYLIQKPCNAKDHRFKSYLKELKGFP